MSNSFPFVSLVLNPSPWEGLGVGSYITTAVPLVATISIELPCPMVS